MTKRIVEESLLRQVLGRLQSVLCDPEGNVCWQGSHADRDIIGDALAELRSALDGDTELNLNCKSVQKRLAAQWGFVPALDGDAVEPVAAIHIGWDYLDNGKLVATYALPVDSQVAPRLYTAPQPAQTSLQLTPEQRAALAIAFSSKKVSVSEVQRKLATSYRQARDLCQWIVDSGFAHGLLITPSLDLQNRTAP